MALDPSDIAAKSKPGAEPPPIRLLPEHRMGLRHMMAAIVGFALLFWLIVGLGWRFLVVLVILTPPMAVVGLVVVLVKRRSTQQDGLLWVMSLSARRGMPLAPGVEAYAALCGGMFRARAAYLAQLLDAGLTLPQAMDRVPDVLPRDATLLARVGWESGTLDHALQDAAQAQAGRHPYRRALAVRLAYLSGVLMALQTIGAFVMYAIAPKLEAIFMDFGVSLPPLTKQVMGLASSPAAGAVLVVLYLAECAALLYIPLAYFGYIGGSIPVLDWLTRRRHAATILRGLAACVEGGRPLESGLEMLARYYPQWLVRVRLARALHDVQQGADWCRSMLARGLIRRPDAAVLDAASRAGNLPWALRELALGIERRIGYRMLALIQALFPIVILALGGLILLFIVAYFQPLITLIHALGEVQ